MWGDTGDKEGSPVWEWELDTSRWGHRAEGGLGRQEMVLGGQEMASDVREVVLVDQEVVLGTRKKF